MTDLSTRDRRALTRSDGSHEKSISPSFYLHGRLVELGMGRCRAEIQFLFRRYRAHRVSRARQPSCNEEAKNEVARGRRPRRKCEKLIYDCGTQHGARGTDIFIAFSDFRRSDGASTTYPSKQSSGRRLPERADVERKEKEKTKRERREER